MLECAMIAAVLFALGYIAGFLTRKPKRDEHGRFTK